MRKISTANAAASASSTNGYVMEDQVGFLMRVAMQRHTVIFMSRMVNGLTLTQFAALARLAEVGTCSQNQLGRLIFLDAATIKGVVDRLRTRKYVRIESDPEDRRRSMIHLTNTGRRVALLAIEQAHKITAETVAPLKPAERRQIVRLLKKLI
jgi:DNA-binding MarR family transcriptional regulator